MSLKRYCSQDVDTITPAESIRTAAGRLHSHKVGCLVVIEDQAGRHPIGILTDRDIAIRVVAEGRDPQNTCVSDVMTLYPDKVRQDLSIEDALRVMRVGSFRRVPVVDDDGRLVGILSLDDVLRAVARELSDISRLIEREGPESLAGE
jgi:CBS domain-containing protein